ncbi:MAG: HDOD domain-containing protein [Deltaproteobacteria bacterium]|nr:HDOD domain-containing protein [Deltaproteobacteria bacterium]
MHDIGRFVLFDADPEELNKVDDSGWATPEDLVEAERDLLGFDHAALAWLVCQHWCIPDHVSEIVRDHHEYEEDCASRDADTKTRVIGIIQIADLLSTSGILQETGKRTEQELSRLITERCLHPCWLTDRTTTARSKLRRDRGGEPEVDRWPGARGPGVDGS